MGFSIYTAKVTRSASSRAIESSPFVAIGASGVLAVNKNIADTFGFAYSDDRTHNAGFLLFGLYRDDDVPPTVENATHLFITSTTDKTMGKGTRWVSPNSLQCASRQFTWELGLVGKQQRVEGSIVQGDPGDGKERAIILVPLKGLHRDYDEVKKLAETAVLKRIERAEKKAAENVAA